MVKPKRIWFKQEAINQYTLKKTMNIDVELELNGRFNHESVLEWIDDSTTDVIIK